MSEQIKQKRLEVLANFTIEELVNPVTQASVIQALGNLDN